jgi:hypothetical protein
MKIEDGEIEKYRNIAINGEDLDREICLQPANHLFVSELSVAADQQYELFKVQAQQLYASIDSQVREEAAAAGKKITEAAVTMQIERHDDYRRAQKTLMGLRGRRELLRALRESWKMRSDLVMELSRRQRDQMFVASGAVHKSAIAA